MNKDIAICVFTYKQPISLRKCIESILNQKLQVFDIFIIDSDINKSSKRVIDFMNFDSKIRLKYYNKYSDNSSDNNVFKIIFENYKYLALLEDNKMADTNWLNELYIKINKNKADIVSTYFGYSFKKLKNQFLGTNAIFNVKLFEKCNIDLLQKFNDKINFDNYILSLKNDYKISNAKKAILISKKHIKYSKLEFVWKRCYMTGNFRFYMLKDKKKFKKIINTTFTSIFKTLSSIIIFLPNLLLLLLGYNQYFDKMIKRFFKSIGFIFGLFGHKFEDL